MRSTTKIRDAAIRTDYGFHFPTQNDASESEGDPDEGRDRIRNRVRDSRNNDRTPSTSSRTAGTTKLREITGTQSPRLSRGRPDTGREREAAKLRDETAERNPLCARAASPEYTEAARLDQKGNPRDRLYSRHRVDVEIFARRPRFLILPRVCQVVP